MLIAAARLNIPSVFVSGGASDPCAVGRRAAAENDAQLESCVVEGDDIVVTVSVPLRLPLRIQPENHRIEKIAELEGLKALVVDDDF